MKEIGLTTKLKEKDSSSASTNNTAMVLATRDTGSATNKTERGRKSGLTVLTTRVTTSTEKSKVRGHSPGKMALSSRVTSLRTRFMALVLISGLMGRCIPGSGRIIRCQGRGS